MHSVSFLEHLNLKCDGNEIDYSTSAYLTNNSISFFCLCLWSWCLIWRYFYGLLLWRLFVLVLLPATYYNKLPKIAIRLREFTQTQDWCRQSMMSMVFCNIGILAIPWITLNLPTWISTLGRTPSEIQSKILNISALSQSYMYIYKPL